jgi:murein DD-endopeptidase MepM/ murein hydrolase activator NlpD
MTPAFADRRLRSVELLQHGQRALREGRRAEARRCFQEAVAANPLEGRAWLELARLSSPVARAFYLVEAFDLNPTNRSILEELRRAYRDVLRLTTGVAPAAPQRDDGSLPAPAGAAHAAEQPIDHTQAEALPASPRPLPTTQDKTSTPPWSALLRVINLNVDDLKEALRRAGHEVALAVVPLARPLVRRAQEELFRLLPFRSFDAESQPLRIYTLPGEGLWIAAALLGVSLITTLTTAGGWQQPVPAAFALGSLRKALLTPTASVTPTPTATATPYPTVITATPIPSATPTETPTDTPQPALNWAPELAANGWTFERGACEAPFTGPVGTETFMWPASNHYLSGYNFSWRYHPGIDIATQLGDPIYASDTGVVVFAGWNSQGYGNLVALDHGNGWETLYAHLSQFNVDCGQAVYQGSVVGYAGSTGNSTGPHLHFEILNDTYGRVNPWSYLP